MFPFTLFSGFHHDILGPLTDVHEDEAPLWMILLHWLLAIGVQYSTTLSISAFIINEL